MRYLGFLAYSFFFTLLVLACNGQKKAAEVSGDVENAGNSENTDNIGNIENAGNVENANQFSEEKQGVRDEIPETVVSENNRSMENAQVKNVSDNKASEDDTILVGQEAKAEMSQEALTKITSDPYSGAEQAETLIIDNSKSLRKFYAQINKTRKPGLPVPDIDFSVETIVVRCSGKTEDGAMPSLHIKEQTEGTIVLGVEETHGENAALAATTPFSVYRLRTSGKEIVVEE